MSLATLRCRSASPTTSGVTELGERLRRGFGSGTASELKAGGGGMRDRAVSERPRPSGESRAVERAEAEEAAVEEEAKVEESERRKRRNKGK